MVRLVVTGLWSLTAEARRADTNAAFDAALLSDAELHARGTSGGGHSRGASPGR